MQVSISRFPHAFDPKAERVDNYDWWSFVRLLQKPEPKSTPKADLPMWSPAVFKGGHRRRANVEKVTLLCFDVDEKPVPTAAELRAGVRRMLAVVHSSSSATNDAPRWRLALALSRPVDAAEYDRLWRAVADSLPFPVGPASKDPSRGWYISREGPDDFFSCFPLEGRPLQVEEWLARAPAPAPKPTSALDLGAGDSVQVDFLEPESLPSVYDDAVKEVGAACAEACPETGARHRLSMLLAGALVGSGLPSIGPFSRVKAEEVPGLVYRICEEAGFGALDQKWRNGVRTVALKRNNGHVQGLNTLREEFPGVAAALGAGVGGKKPPRTLSKEDLELAGVDFVKRAEEAAARISMTPEACEAFAAGPDVSGGETEEDFEEIVWDVKAGGLKQEPAAPTEGLGFEYGCWDEEPPPVEFLVDGLLPAECVSIWFGRANSYKTWLLYSMALALAKGRPWLLKYPTKKCKVGIVDYETGKRNVRNRLFKLRAGAEKNLGVVSYTGLKPNTKEFWVALAREKFDIVFIDSLRRANQGNDENDSGEAIVPLELASEFSELTGCAVVYIHHAKKTSNDGWPEFRGSAAIEDQVDNAFAVKCEEFGASKARVEVKCTKPGDMIAPPPFVTEALFDDKSKTVTLRVVADEPKVEKAKKRSDNEIQSAIKLALIAGPVLTQAKLFEKVGGNKQRFRVELKELQAAGEVRFIPRDGYVLDDDKSRRARVFERIEDDSHGLFLTKARLAEAAFVDTLDVKKMLDEGWIAPRISGGDEVGGFLIIRRE